jgi:hypothetical protein
MFELTAAEAPARSPVVSFLARFFGVAIDGRSYLNLLYLWLAFPLGLAYFVLLVTGFSVGIGLTIIWIGLAILFVLMLAIWGLEGLERVLAIGLLGAAVPERLPAGGAFAFRPWVKAVFKSSALWKGVAFLFIKFPLGMAGWIASVVTLSVSAAFALAPIVRLFGGRVDVDLWLFERWADGPLGLLLLSISGVFMLLVSLHLHNGMAWVWKKLAEILLGGGAAATPPSPAPALASVASA